jgi:hypothetical protein
MELDIASVADRPGLRALYDELDDLWPEFMMKDPTAGLYYGYLLDAYPEYVLIAVDRATGEPVAKALATPLSWDGDIAAGLPEGGWDWAVRLSTHDRLSGAKPVIASALEIMIRPDLRGGGCPG